MSAGKRSAGKAYTDAQIVRKLREQGHGAEFKHKATLADVMAQFKWSRSKLLNLVLDGEEEDDGDGDDGEEEEGQEEEEEEEQLPQKKRRIAGKRRAATPKLTRNYVGDESKLTSLRHSDFDEKTQHDCNELRAEVRVQTLLCIQ